MTGIVHSVFKNEFRRFQRRCGIKYFPHDMEKTLQIHLLMGLIGDSRYPIDY